MNFKNSNIIEKEVVKLNWRHKNDKFPFKNFKRLGKIYVLLSNYVFS